MIDHRIKFEDKYISKEDDTTTLYFIAPKEYLNGKYAEAEYTEISIEFPINNPEPAYATVQFSPTKDGLDYDWFDVNLPYSEIEELMQLAEREDRQMSRARMIKQTFNNCVKLWHDCDEDISFYTWFDEELEKLGFPASYQSRECGEFDIVTVAFLNENNEIEQFNGKF